MLSRPRQHADRDGETLSRSGAIAQLHPPTAMVAPTHSSQLLVALASPPTETVELGRWPRWLVPGLPEHMAGHPSPPHRATPTEPRRL
jgi:hypothetical protein